MLRTLPRLLAGTVATLAAMIGTVSPATAATPPAAAPPAAATPAAATPAAAPPAVALDPHLADVTVAAGGDGKVAAVLGWVDLPAGVSPAHPVTIGRVRVSVDTAGVEGFAAVVVPDEAGGFDPGHSCRTAGTVISCTSAGPFTFGEEPALIPLAVLQITARPGAKAGRTGTLVVTARADDGPVASSTSTMRIGEGVDLSAGKATTVTAAPGTRPDTGLRIGNVGTRPVDGAVLVMIGWPTDLLDGPGFSNCRYDEILIYCTFTDVLDPGRTYRLSDPVRLRIPSDAAAGSHSGAFGMWLTTTEWQELLDLAPVDGPMPGRPGTGGATRLRANVIRESLPQVDTNLLNNIVLTEVVVGGRRTADLAAVGATVRGAAGDRVEARVGFASTGTGTLYPELFANADPATRVVVPPGLKAVTVDERCTTLTTDDLDVEPDPSGLPEYLCTTPTGSTPPGRRTLFDFTFQVRQSTSRTAGAVTVNGELAEGGIDRNARNDRAAITVDVTDTDTDIGGADSGGGGGLPLTGTDAATVTAAGTALVLAGAVTWLLVRRRRIRFTA